MHVRKISSTKTFPGGLAAKTRTMSSTPGKKQKKAAVEHAKEGGNKILTRSFGRGGREPIGIRKAHLIRREI